jgi:hypothetical protein
MFIRSYSLYYEMNKDTSPVDYETPSQIIFIAFCRLHTKFPNRKINNGNKKLIITCAWILFVHFIINDLSTVFVYFMINIACIVFCEDGVELFGVELFGVELTGKSWSWIVHELYWPEVECVGVEKVESGIVRDGIQELNYRSGVVPLPFLSLWPAPLLCSTVTLSVSPFCFWPVCVLSSFFPKNHITHSNFNFLNY